MSKGSFNGLLKGKLGNTVFYKVTNSADKEKQGQRQYVSTIANPRTAPQATQRMRMKPAINFYRGLADLLDHSWEGVKYGALSRQKFMQLALSPTLEGIPFVDKGETRFIPGEYPVSLGSVSVNTIVKAVLFDSGENFGFAQMAASIFTDELTPTTTWGEWSQGTINSSQSQLRDGDELTFVSVYENNGLYIPRHTYVVLDVNSTLLARDVLERARIWAGDDTFFFIDRFINESEENNFYPARVEQTMVAAALIVSRHPTRTSSTWLRTSSVMALSESFKALWQSADRFAAAQQTYRNSDTDLTSDWLLNQAENQQNTSGGSGGGGLIQNFTLENRAIREIGDEADSQLAYYNDGTNEGFVCDRYTIIESAVEGQSAQFSCVNLYTLNGRVVTIDGNGLLAVGTKLISFENNPSVRQNIAQFYTIAGE